MTVSTTSVIDEYTGNSSTTVFAYTSKIFATSDLQVYVNSVLQTLTTHYTVSGVGATGGGNVTFVTAPGGVLVRIVKAIPYTQSTDYVENDPFPAASFEDALDRLTLLVQQVEEITDRSPKFATSSSVRNITFPEGTSAADRANKLVRWNSAGTDLVVTAAGSLGTLVAGVDVFTQRTITADSNISITNGDGVSANPTVKWAGMNIAKTNVVQSSRAMLDFAEGTNINISVTDNAAGTGRAIVTIASTASAGLTRAGGNTTEATTTSTSLVDVVTVSGLSIARTVPIKIIASIRKSSGAAASASVGIKINTTDVTGAFIAFSGDNEAQSGTLEVLISPGDGTYLRTVMGKVASAGAVGNTASNDLYATVNVPNATITAIVIEGLVANAAVTLAVDEVHVYTYATS